MKAKHGEIKAKILALCSKPEGMSLKELRVAIDRQSRTTMSIANPLLARGDLHGAGITYFTRYFTHKEHADAFALIAEAEHQKHLARKLDERRAQWRAKNERDTEKKRKEPKAKKEGKPVLRQSKPYVPPTVRKAQIIWPDHVQVQRIPTAQDTRFTFDPPPGWKGEITRDWMDHRLQSASGMGA